jgi:hypothetical protein
MHIDSHKVRRKVFHKKSKVEVVVADNDDDSGYVSYGKRVETKQASFLFLFTISNHKNALYLLRRMSHAIK